MCSDCCAQIFPKNKAQSFHLSVAPVFGIRKSESEEIIYTDSTDEKLSELNWEETPVFQIGAISFVSLNNFNLRLNFLYGFTNDFGEMTDSDWNLSGLKTTYSIHEEKVAKDISSGFDFFYDFNFFDKKFTLSPGVAFDYNYVSFEARNGYGWYGSYLYSKTGEDVAWNSGNARKAKKVAGIDYSRKSFSTYFSIFAGTQIRNFSAQLGFFISPFTYYDVLDHHYSANSEKYGYDCNYIFKDFFKHLKIDLDLSYKFNNFLRANLSVCFEKQFLDYGTMYSSYYTDNLTKTDQKCGIEFYNLYGFLGLIITIL